MVVTCGNFYGKRFARKCLRCSQGRSRGWELQLEYTSRYTPELDRFACKAEMVSWRDIASPPSPVRRWVLERVLLLSFLDCLMVLVSQSVVSQTWSVELGKMVLLGEYLQVEFALWLAPSISEATEALERLGILSWIASPGSIDVSSPMASTR